MLLHAWIIAFESFIYLLFSNGSNVKCKQSWSQDTGIVCLNLFCYIDKGLNTK